MSEKFKTAKQLRDIYAFSTTFLWTLRKKYPDFSPRVVRKVAGKILYDVEELEKWLGEQKEKA